MHSQTKNNATMTKKKQSGSDQPQIKFDAHNFRYHNAENKKMIRDSLSELGAGRSIVMDNQNELIAGNGVYEQAQKLGMPVRIIETDGSELVVVKRTDLATDDMKRKKLAAADNAISDHVEWNAEEIRLSGLDDATIEALHIELPEIGCGCIEENEADEIERKRREFAARMEAGELSEDDDEYQEFLHKFDPKKTTDDCYTPDVIYEAVARHVAERYGLNRKTFVRPFYPGGNYQHEKYKKTDIVVDNPPFSILARIIDWYNSHGIKYFLFAPHLTLFGTCANRCTALVVDVSITYENGANVSTSFLTNLEDADIVFMSEPQLYKAVKDANDANLKQMRKELPKYTYPDNVITTPVVGRWSKYGINFVARKNEVQIVSMLDSQKEQKKVIFGKGYFISESKRAERERAERERATKWQLSQRERDIIAKLK